MHTIMLPVAQKDKANSYLEAVYKCQILSRGQGWIMVVDKS